MERSRALYALFAEALEYPGEQPAGRAGRWRELLAGGVSGDGEKGARTAQLVEQFASSVEKMPRSQLEELYTATFDLMPACYPYAGYHLMRDDAARADLMVRLRESYHAAGFDAGAELPDHVAVLFRFLSVQQDPEMERDMLELLMLPALEKMSECLQAGSNPYGQIIEGAMLALG